MNSPALLKQSTKNVVLTWFINLLFVATSFAQSAEKVIRVNRDMSIRYDLAGGSYTIDWKGQQLIGQAHALIGAGSPIDSRQAGKARLHSRRVNTSLGRATLYTVSFAGHSSLQQLFYVFKNRSYFITCLRYAGSEAIGYMTPLQTDQLKWPAAGDNRALYVPYDNDMWARYNATPLATADFTGSEVTALYNAGTNQGLVVGSLDQRVWKSGMQVKGSRNKEYASLSAFAGFTDSVVTHDIIRHGKVRPDNGVLYSPQLLVGVFDDWRSGMETFASASNQVSPRVVFNWNKATPMGWNSWGVLREKIRFEQAMGVVDFFADSCQGFRNADNTLFIDLDAFWDNMTPGGLDGDVSKLEAFVKHCKARGFSPGIYWTPFADWGKWDRKVEGADVRYSYAQTWTTQAGRMLDIDGGRAMDPTHPATRQRIVHTLNKMKALGFEMIKIDFLGHGALEADHFFDKHVTTGMQAFHQGMAFLDSVIGKQMLIYAAISPSMATSRFVHVRRIACDAFSSLDNTEYTLNSTGYGWWQRFIYNYIDADHIVFASETEGVNRARMASALVTGTLITGDDYAASGPWNAAGKKLLQNPALLQVIRDGKSFRPVFTNTGNRGVEAFIKTTGQYQYLALFNFGTTSRSFSLTQEQLPQLRQHDRVMLNLFTGESKPLTSAALEWVLPAGDAVILRIQGSDKDR